MAKKQRAEDPLPLPFLFSPTGFSASLLLLLPAMAYRMWRRLSLSLCALCALLLPPAPGNGEISVDQPGAIAIYPKIFRDASNDTIIQITNTSGGPVFLLCIYVNAAPDPLSGEPLWTLTDFQIRLTRQQPVLWVAGEGLAAVPTDGRPLDLHPGPVPPLPEGFIGELRCVVIDDGERPISRNALTGRATLIDRTTGATRKYSAITLRGLPGNNRDLALALNELEYSACPRILLLNHFYDQAPDPILGTPVESSLTLVPCSADYERAVPGSSTLLFETFNEFEQRLSASLEFRCFADLRLSSIDSAANPERSIFHFALQGTLTGQTRIRPVPDRGLPMGRGVVGIAEEFRNNGSAGSAMNLHFIGGSLQTDVMILPSSF